MNNLATGRDPVGVAKALAAASLNGGKAMWCKVALPDQLATVQQTGFAGCRMPW